MTEMFLFVYFVSMLWIVIGGVIGWLMFKRIGAIFAFNLGFTVLAFMIFPGLWGLI